MFGHDSDGGDIQRRDMIVAGEAARKSIRLKGNGIFDKYFICFPRKWQCGAAKRVTRPNDIIINVVGAVLASLARTYEAKPHMVNVAI